MCLKKAVEKCSDVVLKTTPNCENTAKYKELFKKYKVVQKHLSRYIMEKIYEDFSVCKDYKG